MIDESLQLTPLHRLILAYAPTTHRQRYALAFALESRLSEIIRSTSEILIGQMRLTWWRDNLTKPAGERPVGEPLVELFNDLERQGTDLAPLLEMLEGWEFLLDDFPWDDRQFDQYARKRGIGLFGFSAGDSLTEDQEAWSRIWAFWDFARHCSDPAMRNVAFLKSQSLVSATPTPVFDRNGRPLSILCKLAETDARKASLSGDLYRPAVAVKLIWHGITGL